MYVISLLYSSEVLATPTLEMVRAQFFIPEEHAGSTQEDNRSVYVYMYIFCTMYIILLCVFIGYLCHPFRNTECQSEVKQPPAAAGDGLRVRIQQRLENAMALFNTTDTSRSSSQ